MRFRINYELPSGYEDSFEVEGESVEEIREKAMAGLSQRGGTNPWSEELS